MQPQTRNPRSKRTVPDTGRKRKKGPKRSTLNLLCGGVLLFLAAAIVLFGPKNARRQAFYTIGTEDNLVHGANGSLVSEYGGLVFSEVMSSNKTAMPDEHGGYPDWLEVWNSSDHPIRMKNVGLSDDDLTISFLFPDITLGAGERVLVLCDKTNQAQEGKPLHAKFGLSSSGETLYLYDPNAYLLDSVKTPIMSADESYCLQEDGTWVLTSMYSPGYPNTAEGHQAYRSATMVTSGELIINEVCPDPLTGFRDEDGELCDWVELYNTTDRAVSLDNYALSNKENKPLKWRFPQGAYVPAHGYYLVYCSGKEIVTTDTSQVPHANFRLSAEHDTVILSDSRGRLVDRVVIDNIPEDASYARDPDGQFSIHQNATPALPNTQQGANLMDTYLRGLNPTGVYISEVMASNASVPTTGAADFVDWVELYNSSAQAVDLSGYGLSDNLGRARKWQFPQGTTIGPGEYKLVFCDGDTVQNNNVTPHTSYSLPMAGGETLVLADPTGKILDKLVLPAMPTNVSYGRTAGREGFFYYDAATPGAQNGNGFLGYAQAPELTLAPGMYKDINVQVGMTVPEATQVYFTLDGSDPTPEKGTLYTGQEISLNLTTVVRARAYPYDSQYRESEITTGTYLINTYHTLPVISLTLDPELVWNETDGLLTFGANAVKEAPAKLPFKNTVYRAYKTLQRPGYVEYYRQDGTQVLSQGVGIRLSGDYSLDMPQKSFMLRAKSLFGKSTFEAPLFDDLPFTEYKSLVLRNSGNDSMFTRLADLFQSRLLDTYGTTVLHQKGYPVAVYLNGMYWGHFNLRERVDRFFVAQHEGLPLDQADEMDILEASGAVSYGSNKAYRAMVKKIKAGSPATNPEDLQYILDNVDVENLFEYMALEMFVGNSDIGNTRFYRLHREGSKWKWIFYDVDYGLYDSTFNSPWSYTKTTGMGQKKIDNTIFLKILEHPDYKRMFLEKLADIYKTFTTELMLSVLEPMVEEITPEMKLHWERWGELNDKFVISEVPTTVDGAYRYWESRVNRLRNVLKKRPTLLWGYIKDAFKLTDAEMVDLFGPQPEMPADAL